MSESFSLNYLKYEDDIGVLFKKRITKIYELLNGKLVMSCKNGPIMIGRKKKFKTLYLNKYYSFSIEGNSLCAYSERSYDEYSLDNLQYNYTGDFVTLVKDGLKVNKDRILKRAVDGRTIQFCYLYYYEVVRSFVGHTDRVSCCTFYKDDFFLSGSFDNTIKLWHLEKEDCLKTFIGHESKIEMIEISKSNDILSLSDDGCIKQWDYETTNCLATFKDETSLINYFKILSCGNLVTGLANGRVKVWSKYPINEENNESTIVYEKLKSILNKYF